MILVDLAVCRYRKQVEEMQRAFNKTIIKLQNTSRTAEEQVSRTPDLCVCVCVGHHITVSSCSCLQDQRQTDSIQVLQAQLENVTRLVLGLSVSVSRLQQEVLIHCLRLAVVLFHVYVKPAGSGLHRYLSCCFGGDDDDNDDTGDDVSSDDGSDDDVAVFCRCLTGRATSYCVWSSVCFSHC